MFCGGARCDHKLVGYLLVGASGGQKAQHLHFTPRKPVGVRGCGRVSTWLVLLMCVRHFISDGSLRHMAST